MNGAWLPNKLLPLSLKAALSKRLEMIQNPLDTSSLCTIKSFPFDLKQSFFSHYPTMKQGLDESVRFYAEKLTSKAVGILNCLPNCKDWVLTAPPYDTLPAAANLLAWQVQDELQKRCTDHTLQTVNIRLNKKLLQINSQDEFERFQDYSKAGVEDRIRVRAKLQELVEDIGNHKNSLKGRNIIFINDINVSGTQQKFMNRYLKKAEPASIYYLYIIDVDADIGRKHPELEYELNWSGVKTLNEFSRLLNAVEVSYTSRCVERLFSYKLSEFQYLVKKLSSNRRDYILSIAKKEGHYKGINYNANVTFLENYCTERAIEN
jgi:hypothetical protein